MTDSSESLVVHASAVAFVGRGVLILGRSGAGKSALALALVGRGAALVADDRVRLARRGRVLVARAPERIAGMIEARGVGLLRLPAIPEAPIVLGVDLDAVPAARMPHPATLVHLGVSIRLISGRGVSNLDHVVTICVQDGRAFPD